MASYQVRDSPSPHGYSKAQMCFFKILRVISSVPPSQPQPRLTPPHDPSNSSPTTAAAIDVDSRSPFDNAEFQCPASDSSGVEETNAGHEAAEVSGTKEARLTERIGDDREEKGAWEGGGETVPFGGNTRASCDNCLDLLIEAAKVVFEEAGGERGSVGSGLGSGSGSGSGSREEAVEKRWVVVDICNEVKEASPVVRTKRGRSQALPFRYRDSVVEPLRRSGNARSQKKRGIGS